MTGVSVHEVVSVKWSSESIIGYNVYEAVY
jgi:hypothetical protein